MDLFSPLSKNNCMFFYFMAVLSFALFVVTLAYGIFSKKEPLASLALACFAPLITYYVNRLLFSMCVKAL